MPKVPKDCSTELDDDSEDGLFSLKTVAVRAQALRKMMQKMVRRKMMCRPHRQPWRLWQQRRRRPSWLSKNKSSCSRS